MRSHRTLTEVHARHRSGLAAKGITGKDATRQADAAVRDYQVQVAQQIAVFPKNKLAEAARVYLQGPTK